jgi:hypothetical protein
LLNGLTCQASIFKPLLALFPEGLTSLVNPGGEAIEQVGDWMCQHIQALTWSFSRRIDETGMAEKLLGLSLAGLTNKVNPAGEYRASCFLT